MGRDERNQDARKVLAYFYAAYEAGGDRSFVITPDEASSDLAGMELDAPRYDAAVSRL